MKTSEICFKVEKVESPAIGQGMTTTTENACAILGHLPNGEVKKLHDCAERYQLVENATIFTELERLFSINPKTADYEVTVRNHKGQNTMFAVDFRFPQYKSMIKKVDEVIAGFTVRNSYNGKWSFSGYLNSYRQICENGLWGVARSLAVNGRLLMPLRNLRCRPQSTNYLHRLNVSKVGKIALRILPRKVVSQNSTMRRKRLFAWRRKICMAESLMTF